MKSKNLMLAVVAVGCGLSAALISTQMAAKPGPAVDNREPVLVAAKEIPINTKISKENFETFIVTKMYSKESVPPELVNDKEELMGKRLTRSMRAGDHFSPKDLSTKPTVELPPGFDMLTFPIGRDQMVGGFAVPGSRVDVLASVNSRRLGRSYVFPLLTNMLVLAVDINTQAPAGGAIASMSDVSLACTKKQALILHAAASKGAALRLLLRGQEDIEYPDPLTEEEVWAILNDEDPKAKKDDESDVPQAPEVVELPVPMEDLPAGTLLTQELIDSKFTMQKILPPAPINVVKDIREHDGKYLIRDLSASQFVPRSYVADSMPMPEPPPMVAEATKEEPDMTKPAPADIEGSVEKSAPPEQKPVAKTPSKPPVYWDVTVQTATGTKKFRYQVMDSGEYRFLGEIRPESKPEETPAKPTKDEIVPTEAGDFRGTDSPRS